MQSIIARVGLRRARINAAARPFLEASEDLIADVGDGVRLLVHHTPPDRTIGQGVGRTAVLLHGWEGSAMATYVLSAGMRLWNAGYRIVRINLRDHGPSHHLNEELFHSCRLDEVSGAVEWVQARHPQEPFKCPTYPLDPVGVHGRRGERGRSPPRAGNSCTSAT